jgi:hypothetical protein
VLRARQFLTAQYLGNLQAADVESATWKEQIVDGTKQKMWQNVGAAFTEQRNRK